MPRTLVTPAATGVITTAQAKTHMNVTTSGDDTYIGTLVDAATNYAENYTRRALINQTWDFKFNCFKDEMEIPLPPLSSVTSVKYIDGDGTEQTLATSVYTVDTASDPGRVVLSYNQSWPTVRNQINAVTVRAVAGYASTATGVPDEIKHAMKMYVGTLYETRENVSAGVSITKAPITSDLLLNPYKVDYA